MVNRDGDDHRVKSNVLSGGLPDSYPCVASGVFKYRQDGNGRGSAIDDPVYGGVGRLAQHLRALDVSSQRFVDNEPKATVFIADWNDFAAFNEVYAQIFAAPYPARSTIQNSRPLGALVGADAIAASER